MGKIWFDEGIWMHVDFYSEDFRYEIIDYDNLITIPVNSFFDAVSILRELNAEGKDVALVVKGKVEDVMLEITLYESSRGYITIKM